MKKITIKDIRKLKDLPYPFTCITAYDFSSSKIINTLDIPIILVIGKQEQENKSVAVRYLGSKKQELLSLNEFLENNVNKSTPPDLLDN